uniref:Uncharacterized protein n=1 Tax=Tetradesmus obliquus TaxID=3088 RepID=A0A383VKE5_TETOB|eukprot:jgi/Sobl393_1/1379/SZX64836.1
MRGGATGSVPIRVVHKGNDQGSGAGSTSTTLTANKEEGSCLSSVQVPDVGSQVPADVHVAVTLPEVPVEQDVPEVQELANVSDAGAAQLAPLAISLHIPMCVCSSSSSSSSGSGSSSSSRRSSSSSARNLKL